MAQCLEPWGARLEPNLRLSHQLAGAIGARGVPRDQVVSNRQRFEIVGLEGQLLETIGELSVGPLRASEFAPHADGLGVPANFCESVERPAKMRGSLGSGLRFEIPLDELPGDNPSPAEAIAQLDVRF